MSSYQKPKREGYMTSREVAARLQVTEWTVRNWRNLGIFIEDMQDHNGVYWYSEERVEQLKSVYRNGTQQDEDVEATSQQVTPKLPATYTTVTTTYTTTRKLPTIAEFKAMLEEQGKELDRLIEEQEIKTFGKAKVLQWRAQEIRENTEKYQRTVFKDNKLVLSGLLLKDKSGKVKATLTNFELVFDYDPYLMSCVGFNRFANRLERRKEMPWTFNTNGSVLWSDEDDTLTQNHIEREYGFRSSTLYHAVLTEIATRNSFHPVRDYLECLPPWDREERLGNLLVDCLGAEESSYVRLVTQYAIVAAVARIYHPGCKWDYVLVIKGSQGCGKSSLLRWLFAPWFNDSIYTLEGKDVYEQIQGCWGIELGELQATNKSDNERIKSFVSSTSDRVRLPYDRRASELPRQCIFFGTTNEENFLRDLTGGRRFLVIETTATADTTGERLKRLTDKYKQQLWAEALFKYKMVMYDGFDERKLDIDAETKQTAAQMQNKYTEGSELEGNVSHFLEMLIPAEQYWQELNKDERRSFAQNGHVFANGARLEGTRPRDKVCAAEILYEGMGLDTPAKERSLVRQINEILARTPGWQRASRNLSFSQYGRQRTAFVRCDISL